MAHPFPGRIQAHPRVSTQRAVTHQEVVRYIDLKLAALGHSTSRHTDSDFFAIAQPLLRNYRQKDLMLGNLLCPADRRIQGFLDDYLKDVWPGIAAQLPASSSRNTEG